MTKKSELLISASEFLPENDTDYLNNRITFEKRILSRIEPEHLKDACKKRLNAFITELEKIKNLPDLEQQQKQIKQKAEQVLACDALNSHWSEKELKELNLDNKQKHEINAAFISALIRFLILREEISEEDTLNEREALRKRIQSEEHYFSFLGEQTGDSKELTYLFRFERAILQITSLTDYINKQLFLIIGNILEGSKNSVRYTDGGGESKATKRRKKLIACLCTLQSKKHANDYCLEFS